MIKKQIQFCVEVDAKVPETLIGDCNRIRQILTNLLGNAVKFVPQGGAIGLLVNVREMTDKTANLEFSVTDSGVGIPEDKLDMIFHEFTQVDSSSTRTFGGTGLGLTIARRLARLMNGEIYVRSSVGVGSVFTAVIPLEYESKVSLSSEAQPIETIAPASTIAHYDGLKALVVEDNEVNQRLISLLLSRRGVNVLLAKDGQEALDLLARETPQIVFMDCQMPVLDGYDATRQIRINERAAGTHVPIVALTANAMSGDREKCLEAGMDDYLSKPIVKSELERVLQHYGAKHSSKTLS